LAKSLRPSAERQKHVSASNVALATECETLGLYGKNKIQLEMEGYKFMAAAQQQDASSAKTPSFAWFYVPYDLRCMTHFLIVLFLSCNMDPTHLTLKMRLMNK